MNAWYKIACITQMLAGFVFTFGAGTDVTAAIGVFLFTFGLQALNR